MKLKIVWILMTALAFSPVLLIPGLRELPSVGFVSYFIFLPGTYLLLRTKLVSSIVEAFAAGTFCGFGLLALTYIGLSKFVPVNVIDVLMLSAAGVSLALTFPEIKKQGLPFWEASNDKTQWLIVLATLLFLLTLGLGDLVGIVDDDHFIHFPNIKRISMGDVPPHVPYFPDLYLQGHVARDIFIGTIARFLNLRPNLAIIYTTISIFPAFILMFYSLAYRMAGGQRCPTIFTFFGLLFLVSGAVGGWEIRTGCITYVWNNNTFAAAHAAYFAWLIQKLAAILSGAADLHIAARLFKYKSALLVAAVSYAALYFVYVSNFLLFTLLLAALPLYSAVATSKNRLAAFAETTLILAFIAAGTALFHIAVSPSLLERVLVSFGFSHPDAPMLLAQQQHLKLRSHPFEILPNVHFLSPASLVAQGFSFYLGLLGLMVGIATKRHGMAIASLFGWVTMVWLWFVDMGQYGSEYPRLMLAAHTALGASAGLLIGVSLDTLLCLLRKRVPPQASLMVQAFLIIAMSTFVIWMGSGNFKKYADKKSWRVSHNLKRLNQLHEMNPNNWHPHLNMSRIDYDALKTVEKLVTDHRQKALIRLKQEEKFKDPGGHGMPMEESAATICGVGIAGVTLKHEPGGIFVNYIPTDLRASLFWLAPSEALLTQLSPNWLLIDPSLLSKEIIESIRQIPGITEVATLRDKENRERIIFSYHPAKQLEQNPDSGQLQLLTTKVKTKPFVLAKVAISLKSSRDPKQIRIGMLVTDKTGEEVNRTDLPAVEITKTGNNQFSLHFTMIQSGAWDVYFVNPITMRKLHSSPLQVDVEGI